MVAPATDHGRVLGRYVLHDQIGAGGMAVVHVARLTGLAGFSRTVAIKLLHPHLAKDPDFSSMLLDEARLAARIRHQNVVPTLDVVATDHDLFLVMELVQGESLSQLLGAAQRANERMPVRIASAIMIGVLQGLQAAHDATGAGGEPLGIVHRDVSPQNVLVGTDGVARVLDFGVAKAAGRMQTTRDGQIKGKASYMAPEQIRTEKVDARADVYAAAVVLWEMLATKRLFVADSMEATINMVLERTVAAPSTLNPEVSPALDALVLRGLSRNPTKRFASASEMAVALEEAVPPATSREVASWVDRIAGDRLRVRAASIAKLEAEDVATSEPPEAANTEPQAVGEETTVPLRGSAPSLGEVRSPPVRRSRFVYIAGAVTAVAAVIALWFVLTGQSDTPARPAAASTAEPPAPMPPAPTPAVGSPASTPSPSSSAPVADSRPPSPQPVKRASGPAAPSKKPPRRARAKNCDPPYTIDKQGFRSPKLECLK